MSSIVSVEAKTCASELINGLCMVLSETTGIGEGQSPFVMQNGGNKT